jgi:hypothetical protein
VVAAAEGANAAGSGGSVGNGSTQPGVRHGNGETHTVAAPATLGLLLAGLALLAIIRK